MINHDNKLYNYLIVNVQNGIKMDYIGCQKNILIQVVIYLGIKIYQKDLICYSCGHQK